MINTISNRMMLGCLGIGPMSPYIIEAVYIYSHTREVPLMLIASKNQIDYNQGYVFKTSEYKDFLDRMRNKYTSAKVLICRDHCGPGFNGIWDMEDVYSTIEHDIKAGFDLVHVDLCMYRGSHDEMLKESKKVILHMLKLNPNIQIEIGTDVNDGKHVENIDRVTAHMKYFSEFCLPTFFVTQTGSLIKEMSQVGSFHNSYIQNVRYRANDHGLMLKEHNGDYLGEQAIQLRRGYIDAINIAPQLGILQTQLTLQKATLYGISVDDFLQTSYESKNWKKWMDTRSSYDAYFCSIIAGHYNFFTYEYKRIFEAIMKHENFIDAICKEIHTLIDLYVRNLTSLPARSDHDILEMPRKTRVHQSL